MEISAKDPFRSLTGTHRSPNGASRTLGEGAGGASRGALGWGRIVYRGAKMGPSEGGFRGGCSVFRPGHMQPLETPAVLSEGSLSRKRREEKRASERPELQSIKKVFGRYSKGIDKVFGKCPVSIRKVFIKYSESVQ